MEFHLFPLFHEIAILSSFLSYSHSFISYISFQFQSTIYFHIPIHIFNKLFKTISYFTIIFYTLYTSYFYQNPKIANFHFSSTFLLPQGESNHFSIFHFSHFLQIHIQHTSINTFYYSFSSFLICNSHAYSFSPVLYYFSLLPSSLKKFPSYPLFLKIAILSSFLSYSHSFISIVFFQFQSTISFHIPIHIFNKLFKTPSYFTNTFLTSPILHFYQNPKIANFHFSSTFLPSIGRIEPFFNFSLFSFSSNSQLLHFHYHI